VPLGKSHVSVVVDGREFDRKTNRRGEFSVAPDMHHFWTWLGGPIWMDATNATVGISMIDYTAYQSTFAVLSMDPDVPVAPDRDRLQGSYIMLGDILMKKREPDSGGNP
jgi:hypothetical protein